MSLTIDGNNLTPIWRLFAVCSVFKQMRSPVNMVRWDLPANLGNDCSIHSIAMGSCPPISSNVGIDLKQEFICRKVS